MRYAAGLFSLVLASGSMSGPALAQHSNGYLFVAPGAVSSGGTSETTVQAGVGFEIALPKGFGAGAELGALGATQYYNESVVLTLSPGAYFHIPRRSSKLDPFVEGGYTAFVRNSVLHLFHFGGGVNYWFRPRLGLRLEFRDHVNRSDGTLHFWGFRFGLAF